MGELYYKILQSLNPEARAVTPLHGISFVVVLDGKLEHRVGDEEVTREMIVEDGKLKSRAGYEFIQLDDKTQFDIETDSYLRQIKYEERERGVHQST